MYIPTTKIPRLGCSDTIVTLCEKNNIDTLIRLSNEIQAEIIVQTRAWE